MILRLRVVDLSYQEVILVIRWCERRGSQHRAPISRPVVHIESRNHAIFCIVLIY